VFEMGQDERGAGDITDLARAGSDPLEGAPAALEQGEPAFAAAPDRADQHVAGQGIDIEGRAVAAGLGRDGDGRAGAVAAGVGRR
jgi:hypothetical protein